MTFNFSPKVSVVVINQNGSPFVVECIRSVLNTQYDNFQLVFFDNGSVDESHLAVKEICRSAENVLLLRSTRAMPVARAMNLAIRIAAGHARYVAHLDNDVIVFPDWLTKLQAIMQSHDNVFSCQPLLISAHSPGIIDGTGDFIDIFGNAVSRHSGMKIGKIEVSSIAPDILSSRSAAMLVKSDLYERVGGLDESFGFIFEDVDLGWRSRLAGFSNRIVADSVVLHRAGSTTRRLTRAHVAYLGTRNRLQMLLKNYEVLNILRYVSIRVIIDFVSSVFAFLVGKPMISIAIVRGLAWNLLNFRYVWQKHAAIQAHTRAVPDSQLLGKYIRREPLFNALWSIHFMMH